MLLNLEFCGEHEIDTFHSFLEGKATNFFLVVMWLAHHSYFSLEVLNNFNEALYLLGLLNEDSSKLTVLFDHDVGFYVKLFSKLLLSLYDHLTGASYSVPLDFLNHWLGHAQKLGSVLTVVLLNVVHILLCVQTRIIDLSIEIPVWWWHSARPYQFNILSTLVCLDLIGTLSE